MYTKVLLLLFSLIQTYLCLVPQPHTISYGNHQHSIHPSVEIISYSQSRLLRDAIDRYRNLIFPVKVENPISSFLPVIDRIEIETVFDSEDLNINTDESYSLMITEIGPNHGIIEINATTIFGAKHALETLSQLVKFDTKKKEYKIENTPLKIYDTPRFRWRGLLLDTSRHFMTKESILSTINGMEAGKMNVFHWHIVDAESFPLESKKHPLLHKKGAYDENSFYSQETINEVIQYAKNRGIRVVIEVDVPGHAASWGHGDPDIIVRCPKYEHNINNIPVDPTSEHTYNVINDIYSEISSLSDEEYIHTGGDEVVFGCFTNNSKILEYMKDHGITDAKVLAHIFEERLDGILSKLGRKKIIWQDMFGYGAKVDPNTTLVHLWNDKTVLKKIVQRGISAIVSEGFYINHLYPWETYYNNDPLSPDLLPNEKKLVLGGEACVWAEKIDSDVLDAVIWPRGTAIAERLWSPENVRDKNSLLNRLKDHICHLKRRNVKAVPVAPGHCYY